MYPNISETPNVCLKIGKSEYRYIFKYIVCNYLFTKHKIVSSDNGRYFYLFGCFMCFWPAELNWSQISDTQIYHASIIMIRYLGFYNWLPANDKNRNGIYVWVYGLYHSHVCPRRDKLSGPRLNIKTVFPGTGIPMLKIRRSWNRLIFNIEIPILVRRHLYTETAPRVAIASSTLSTLFKHTLHVYRFCMISRLPFVGRILTIPGLHMFDIISWDGI